MDSSECQPTFNTSPNNFIGLKTRWEKSLIKALEGAKDSENLGKEDLIKAIFIKMIYV